MTAPTPAASGARHVALVTGASSGIGAAFCRLLAHEGYDLVVVARRIERLQQLQRELEGRARVLPLAADLAAPDSPANIHRAVVDAGLQVDTLINNAGYALPGTFLDTRWDDQAQLIQVLAVAPAQLIRLFAPAMVARGYGRVLNVASIAAFAPASPKMTLYAPLKHFVMTMSASLRGELQGTGVSVTTLCPGPTATEWAEVADMGATFAGLPRWSVLSAAQVAQQGYDAMMRGDSKVVTGCATRLTAALMPFIPESVALTWLARNAPSD